MGIGAEECSYALARSCTGRIRHVGSYYMLYMCTAADPGTLARRPYMTYPGVREIVLWCQEVGRNLATASAGMHSSIANLSPSRAQRPESTSRPKMHARGGGRHGSRGRGRGRGRGGRFGGRGRGRGGNTGVLDNSRARCVTSMKRQRTEHKKEIMGLALWPGAQGLKILYETHTLGSRVALK